GLLVTPSPSGSAPGLESGGASMASVDPSSTMPEGVTTRPPELAASMSGSAPSSPISFLKAPTRNSRMEIVLPSAKNGRTRRSGFTPSTFEVSSVPSGLAVIDPKEIPLLRSLLVTGAFDLAACCRAAARILRRSLVISSASISFRPRPNRCGASRLSGRGATSPPTPPDPRGRPGESAPPPARRSTGTAVASGTTIGKPRADSADVVDVADPIAVIGPLPLSAGKLALEELAAATHGTERIPVDNEQGRIGSHQIAPPGSDFVCQRLVDPCLGRVGGLVVINHLPQHRRRGKNSKKKNQSYPEH